jgi:hypothetical protein
MIVWFVAVLMLAAQPAAPEEPVTTTAEAETEVQTETAEVRTEAQAEAEEEAERPQEEVICRRRLRPAERVGQRHRVVRDCRPASEWSAERRRNG